VSRAGSVRVVGRTDESADDDIFEHRHARECPDHLKGTPDPAPAYLARAQAGNRLAGEGYRAAAAAAVRAVELQLHEPRVGALTPVQAFGAEFALLVPGTRIQELERP